MPAGKYRSSAVLLVLALAPAAPAASPSPPPQAKRVDFERHVMGLLSRAGCNAGSCHGSFQGKGGLRLSLFGSDPAADHAALARNLLGRRVDPLRSERSLLLLKATGQVAHGGGRRFAPGTWEYGVFRAWIAAGARRDAGSGDVAALTLTPAEHALVRPGASVRVRARARFRDGSEEDVTHLCDFRARDEAVATVLGPGLVRAGRPGDTALLVSYRGNVRALRVLVPVPVPAGFRYPNVPEVNFVDRLVFAKLRLINVVPSELSSDAEFLRRVTLDTIGSLPSPEEVRAFLADRRPDKRTRKIDELLAHPLHAALWATRLSDITGNDTNGLRARNGPTQVKFSQMWHDWLRKRVADNMPYDQIVRGLLTASSREGRSWDDWVKEVDAVEKAVAKGFYPTYADRRTLDLFWKVGVAPTLEQYAERTAAAFLGVRLECAQCHKHPFDRWTQADYRAYANVFGHVVMGSAPDTSRFIGGRSPLPRGAVLITEVYVGGKGRELPPPDWVPIIKEIIIGRNGKKQVVLMSPPPRLLPRALGGPIIPVEKGKAEKGKDPRLSLFEWMRSPDNAFFARSFVNRVWGHYFGVGIVDPVDDFSQANPPSNARLLDALAKDFVDSGYDIRRLERTILLSRTYQLSSTMNATNRLDRSNFSHSYLRPLLAEVVVDALGDATGLPDDFGKDAPPGRRAIEVGAVRLLSADLSYALRTFGRPDRAVACDCERGTGPSLAQTLYRMADPVVVQKVGAFVVESRVKGKVGAPPEGRLAKLLKSKKSTEEVVEELFLATLSRFPTEAERKHLAAHRAAWRARAEARAPTATLTPEARQARDRKEREAVCADALWALLNTREFILNH
jgi:hypothetical protein